MTTIAQTQTRSRDEIEQEIRETLGLVPSFFDRIPDEILDREWQLLKHWGFGETHIPNQELHKSLNGFEENTLGK